MAWQILDWMPCYRVFTNIIISIDILNVLMIISLLGLNGVGKTTFIKMLVGEAKQTSGDIYLNGYDLNRSYFKARNNIGYCPQFSQLPEYLTVLECLELFADLKGLDRYTTPFILSDLIELFKLNELIFKLVQNLR